TNPKTIAFGGIVTGLEEDTGGGATDLALMMNPIPAAAINIAIAITPSLFTVVGPPSTQERGSRCCASIQRSGGSRSLKTLSRSRMSGIVFLQEMAQPLASLAQVDA